MQKPLITLGTIVGRAVNIPFAQVHDEMLAIDEQAGAYYVLNETSGRVWELIAEPVSAGHVCRKLYEEYDVDEATCQREVLQLLGDLRKAGLVRVID